MARTVCHTLSVPYKSTTVVFALVLVGQDKRSVPAKGDGTNNNGMATRLAFGTNGVPHLIVPYQGSVARGEDLGALWALSR